ncbi:MAG TPA: rhodanese-related sulfurtransferase [Candidatus Kapabacteria bacterium]|nr:rhodanese-related sulfurtransferase [Candidatus Kapabacteria bacterium]
MYHVLLYYKIVRVGNPSKEVLLQREICTALQLKGRILIADHGINGTVGGSKASIDLYRAYMNQHHVFKDIDFKESTSDVDPFPTLSVKARKEIVTTDALPTMNIFQRGKHVDRDTFHDWLVRGEDMVLLDMRNDYEWAIGRFIGSVCPPIKYFRDLKDSMDFYEQFKGKKIVMYCTGGVRCEPASALFLSRGFDPANLYQLDGGIVKYAEKYGNAGYYEGKCFVFDERMAVPVNTTEHAKIIGACLYCQQPCDVYRNCANKYCNRLFLSCESCTIQKENTCSLDCREQIKDIRNVRPAHASDIRVLHRNK